MHTSYGMRTMTIDTTIGRILSNGKHVMKCPRAEHNICNPQYTNHPRDSYRSGSSKLRQFWQTSCGEFYNTLEEEITPLKQYQEQINKLDANDNAINTDRMLWLKYWTNKAVELYGDDAGIQFAY